MCPYWSILKCLRIFSSHGASQVALVVKTLPASTGDTGDVGSIPGSGRSPGGGNGKLLQYSCLLSLSVLYYLFSIKQLEKEMANHSSILAWRIPWTEKSGGLQSTGWQNQTGLSD